MAKKKVIKSASGNYRANQKPLKDYPEMTNTTNIRRTVKGVIKGAPTVNERKAELNATKTNNSSDITRLSSYTNPMGGTLKYIMSKKKGGSITALDQVQRMHSKKKK